MQTESAQVGNLDMTDERDRGLLRRSVAGHITGHNKRWGGVSEDFKQQAVQALRVALRMALESKDHRNVRGCVETLARLEAQNQADEHREDDNERLDAGKLVAGSGLTINVHPLPRTQLPP